MKSIFNFFCKTFEFVKTHWKVFVVGFIVFVLSLILFSCQGLVNFNGSDGNNMVIGDSNSSSTSVFSYGK